MPKLSVVIITLNEEPNILRALESVKPFADEIVVVDSISSDQTVKICREFGCRVYQRAFDGYGSQKQFAVDQASNDWVFAIDADEVVTKELQNEIIALFADTKNSGFSGLPHPAYRIPRSLNFMGRLLRHGGAGQEFLVRIFDRTKGGFTKVPVHEGIEVNGPKGILHGLLIHYSYKNIRDHLERINTYTSLAAKGNLDQGRSFPKIWAALKFPVSFISVYLIKRGFLDGYPGFMWSFLSAVYAVLKVAKTIELTQKP